MRFFLEGVICFICLQANSAAPVDSFNVTFAVSAESLPRKDYYTQPDAFLQIYNYVKSADESKEGLELMGSTVYIRDEMNPDWNEVFSFPWVRGSGQTWLFKVIDHDISSSDDLIGTADVDVDEFMETDGNFRVNLSHGGSVTIKRTLPIKFKLSAKNLPPRDRYFGSNGLSDPYAIVSYLDSTNTTEKEFHRTACLTDNANPTWTETIEFSKYEPKSEQTLHVQIYDRDLFSRDEFLGEAFIKADDVNNKRGVTFLIPLEGSEDGAFLILRTPRELPKDSKEETEAGIDLHLTTSPPLYNPTTTASVLAESYYHYDNEIHDEVPK